MEKARYFVSNISDSKSHVQYISSNWTTDNNTHNIVHSLYFDYQSE